MANTIQHLRSSTPGDIPPALEDGEIAINQADKRVFYKDSAGVIRSLFFFPVSFTADFGFPARQSEVFNIVDPFVRTTSKIQVSWDDVADTDENDPEMDDVVFKTVSNTGSFSLTISSRDNGLLGGIFKLKYQIF